MSISKCFVEFVVIPIAFITSAMAAPVVEGWTTSRSAYDLHAVAPDRFVIESVNGKSYAMAAKFIVAPGDVFKNSSGERSEVVLGGWRDTSRFHITGEEGVEYYRISVKLEAPWLSPEYNGKGQRWGIIFQIHGPDEYHAPPSIALHVEEQFGLFVFGGDISLKQGGRRFLSNPSLNPGQWVDFILAIKWAVGADGFIEVYRRDEGESNWMTIATIPKVATLQYKGAPAVRPHYSKAGFYRSNSSHTNSLWLGPIIRAKSFAEAAK